MFLSGSSVIPIVYNANVAFTNWSTGHNLTKDEAIAAIQETSLAQPPNGAFVHDDARPARTANLVLLLVDEATGKTYVGTEDGLEPLAPADVDGRERCDHRGEGLRGPQGRRARRRSTRSSPTLVVPADGDSFVRAEGLSTAVELKPTLRYDPEADTFTNIETGVVYSDNGKGSYATPSGEELEPGLADQRRARRTSRTIFTDPLIRDPFVCVFVWTFVLRRASPCSSRSRSGSSSRSR